MLYADSSALVKLAYQEPESEALARVVTGETVCSSIVTAAEVTLAARKVYGAPGAERADDVLTRINLIDLGTAVVEEAAQLVELRMLDAIHVGTALSIAGDLEGVVTYDRRMATAADSRCLKVLSPS